MEAAELFGEGTLCYTVPNSTAMKPHLQQALLGMVSQTQIFSISAALQHQMESTGRKVMDEQVCSQLSVSEGLSPPQCPLSGIPCLAFPVLSSLPRITLTLACPMDLKNFPMDVQTCIMQLESCESCVHPHFGEETTSFPFCSPLPSPFPAPTHSQPSLHWRFARESLA